MATIRKRTNGKWQAIVRVKGHKQQSKTFRRKADAQKWSKVIESEIEQGSYKRTESILFSSISRQWLDNYAKSTIAATKTMQIRKNTNLINGLNKHFGNLYLQSITPQDIAQFKDNRLKAVKPPTVRRELVVVSSIFTFAEKDLGYQLDNPVGKIRLPKDSIPRARRISDQELEAILFQLRNNPTMSSIVQLAFYTAMRRSEVGTLIAEQIDLDNRTIHLPTTKNGSSRTVPLSEEACKVLEVYKPIISNPEQSRHNLFNVKLDSITQAFGRACKRAGIEGLHFHDLRHEAISRWQESGKLNATEIAQIAGHKDLLMTYNYTHLRAEDLAKKL